VAKQQRKSVKNSDVLSTNIDIKQTAHQNRQSSEYNTVRTNIISHLNVSSGGQLKIKIIQQQQQ